MEKTIHLTIHRDRELLQRLKNGDSDAFRVLYDLHKEKLTANVLRLVKSEDLAQDILQELFTKMWTERHRIDIDKPLQNYLFRISKNLIIDTFRRSSRDKTLFSALTSFATENYVHVEEDLFRKEEQELLQGLIAQLPPKRREIFVAAKLEGKSYQEIATERNISIDTVNDHIKKAYAFFRKLSNKRTFLLLVLYMQYRVFGGF